MREKSRGRTSLERRDFLKAAAVVTATGALEPRSLLAAHPMSAVPGQQQDGPPPVPLGNGEHPAQVFQAYPGGTGSLMERLWRESGGSPFERTPITIPNWSGPVPTDGEEVAFLPVHRLSALCAVTILDGRAREEAQQADAELRSGNWRGPLHGIPYGVKDLFSVSGAPTTWGSAAFVDQMIDEDAEVVVRLREAGAVLIAKLATGEFARGDRWYRGRTRNPWNVEEGSSGSSAGPGSATAAACVAFGIGTETQGSIVSPARRNGVSALRPTFGRVSRHGGMVLSWSMDKVGPLCRSIEDCALVFNAIHGASEKDPATLTAPFRFDRGPDLGSLRIGYTEDAPESFLQELSDLGAGLQEMPELPRGSSSALSVESSAAFDFHIAPDGVEPEPLPDDLEPAERRNRGRFRRGRDVRGIDYVNGQRRRLILMKEMAEVMEGVDMFVSGSGQVGLTNQTGHPAAIVPYGFGVRNPDDEAPTTMPLTTTLIGNLFADDKILSVAHAYQTATDWHLRRPPLG
jgi:Asp-tRNA(Asn)/Glu-tRNA(Gln) amidotransferase A subunit family amidase